MKQTKLIKLQQEYTTLTNSFFDGRSTHNTRNIKINNFVAKFTTVEMFKEFFNTIAIQNKVVDSVLIDLITKKFNAIRKTNFSTNEIIFNL